MTRQQIIDSARQLPREEQLDLAMELWELVGPRDDELPLTAEQRAELDRRLDAYRADPSEARPWDEVRSDLLKKLHDAR